jgi:hypothetical protein
MLVRSFEEKELPDQIQTYNKVMDLYGKGAGMAYFDGIVVVFVEHLLQLGLPTEALKSLEKARKTLRIQDDSQLAGEFQKLEKRIRGSK